MKTNEDKTKRNAEIYQRRGQGESMAALARAFGVTESTIKYVVESMKNCESLALVRGSRK